MLDHDGLLAFFERAHRLRPDIESTATRLCRRTGPAAPPQCQIRRRQRPPQTLCHRLGRRRKIRFPPQFRQCRFPPPDRRKDGLWLFANAGTLAKQNIEGHDVSPAVTDFDGDGIPDFLGGAEDGRFYTLRNPLGRQDKQ